MSTKKPAPRQITLSNLNIDMSKETKQEELALLVAKCLLNLTETLKTPAPSYGIYIEGDKNVNSI